MSYILDALRKSDQERQRDAAPAAQSIHARFAPRRKTEPSLASIIATGALLVAGVAAGAFWGARWNAVTEQVAPVPSGSAPALPASVAAVPAVATAPPAANGPASSTPTVTHTPPAAGGAPEANAEFAPSADARMTGVVTAEGELLELWQLTEAEQRFLQGLQVSMHVYSAEPLQRTVIINGFRVREGQPLGQDLALLEIVPDGVVVAFQGKRVHLSTVKGW